MVANLKSFKEFRQIANLCCQQNKMLNLKQKKLHEDSISSKVLHFMHKLVED